MAIHLFIVAEEDRFLDPFKTARNRAVEVENSFIVRTCRSPEALLMEIREVVLKTHQRVDTLDIFGHGCAGHQYLGNQVLFGVENGTLSTGKEIAHGLRRFLTRDARVRLLGCMTAIGESGRALLLSLREELGESVVVMGTITSLNARDRPPNGGFDDGEFDERGFNDTKEDDWLFSSTDARRKLAPTHRERAEENRVWFAGIKDG
jgi:hypothetical protein